MVMDKSGSFGNKKNDNAGTPKHATAETPESPIVAESEENDTSNHAEEPLSFPANTSLADVIDEVDKFLEGLDQQSDPSEAPSSVELLMAMVEKMIGEDKENDASFLDAVSRVSELSKMMGRFGSSSLDSVFNKASVVLQKAMSFLDEEFRNLLEDPKPEKSTTPKQSSFKHNNQTLECNSEVCVLPDQNSDRQTDQDEQIFPALPPETVARLAAIAGAMIAAGYEAECSLSYAVARRSSFKAAVEKLGYDGINVDDVQKMPWDSLQNEIATWVSVVKACSSVLFPAEASLSAAVFPNSAASPLGDLPRSVAARLLGFAEAVVITRRSAEKLFKFLDMYESLRDLEKSVCGDEGGDGGGGGVAAEVAAVKSRLREAVASTFCNLENSIKSEQERTPMPSGTVHPLTRYVMNYLEFTCAYKDTLEQIFQHCHHHSSAAGDGGSDEDHDSSSGGKKRLTATPFANQLETVMDLLDANLEAKSKLYRDPSLTYIFLMNNGRYIVQKIKASSEIHQLMGDTWCRKRSSELRQYHKNYQRETWGKVLQCLRHEGLQVNGKVLKPVLKERFKSFNAMFEEIHKAQSGWVVTDEQLQSELRVSVSAVMIPAYRAFLGRFKQYLDSGRQTEKYIKYQPEDIETMIDDLFDGNTASIVRRRSYN